MSLYDPSSIIIIILLLSLNNHDCHYFTYSMSNIHYFLSKNEKKITFETKKQSFQNSFIHKVFPKGSLVFFFLHLCRKLVQVCIMHKVNRKTFIFPLFSFVFYTFSPLPKNNQNQLGILTKNKLTKKCFFFEI